MGAVTSSELAVNPDFSCDRPGENWKMEKENTEGDLVLTPKPAPLGCSGMKSPPCHLSRGRFFSRHSPCVQIVEQSWGRNQKSWLVPMEKDSAPKPRESLCVQMISCGKWDQMAHKDVARYPKS